jgi:hypothetical protein
VVTESFPEFFSVNSYTAHQALGATGWRMLTADDAANFAQALDTD